MDELELSLLYSNITTEFKPGGYNDKVPVSVVRDFFIRKYPHIRNDQKRGRLFRQAFQQRGHHIRRMTPGSRREKNKPCYYYVRKINKVRKHQTDLEDSCSDLMPRMCEQSKSIENSLDTELGRIQGELDAEKVKRIEADQRINVLETKLEESTRREYETKGDMSKLQKVLDNERLRSNIAEEKALCLAYMLRQEQEIRWKAVQELNKAKPHSHIHIPEVQKSHVSDMKKTLGNGTFGRVRLYQYHDKRIAVKEFSKNPKGYKMAKLEMCVLKEANMMLSCKPHPNIVNLLGFMKTSTNFTDSNFPRLSLVTEHINGSALWTLINLKAKDRRKQGIPWKQILKETADGVMALHKMNIIHNDLKEDNIMVRQDNKRPVIIDFGKATFADKPRWEKYKLKSKEEIQEWTKEYPWIAPELLEDNVLPSQLTDAYSFGFICLSVYQRTCFKDESAKNVWKSLYKREPRSDILTAVEMFH